MFGWDLLVDALRAVLVVLTHAFGGSLGTAIVAVSIVVRLLLLPLTLRVALESRALERRKAKLKPELDRLAKRHADDPVELLRRTRALHEKHGIPALPRGTLALMLVQLPLGGALYQAIRTGLGVGQRFLWLADLGRPDAMVAGIAALLAAGTVAASGPSASANGSSATWAGMVVSGAVTLFIVWRLAAGVGLYWGASSLVGIAQGLLVRRAESRAAATA